MVKNKLAPPFKMVSSIMYGRHLQNGEIIDLGVKAGVVEIRCLVLYDSQRIGQGREVETFLKANPDIAAKIEAAIRQNSGVSPSNFGRKRHSR